MATIRTLVEKSVQHSKRGWLFGKFSVERPAALAHRLYPGSADQQQMTTLLTDGANMGKRLQEHAALSINMPQSTEHFGPGYMSFTGVQTPVYLRSFYALQAMYASAYGLGVDLNGPVADMAAVLILAGAEPQQIEAAIKLIGEVNWGEAAAAVHQICSIHVTKAGYHSEEEMCVSVERMMQSHLAGAVITDVQGQMQCSSLETLALAQAMAASSVRAMILSEAADVSAIGSGRTHVFLDLHDTHVLAPFLDLFDESRAGASAAAGALQSMTKGMKNLATLEGGVMYDDALDGEFVKSKIASMRSISRAIANHAVQPTALPVDAREAWAAPQQTPDLALRANEIVASTPCPFDAFDEAFELFVDDAAEQQSMAM